MPKQVCSVFSNTRSSQLNMRQKIKDLNKRLEEFEARGRGLGLEEHKEDKKIEFPNGVEEVLFSSRRRRISYHQLMG